jgi:hypothetical protein
MAFYIESKYSLFLVLTKLKFEYFEVQPKSKNKKSNEEFRKIVMNDEDALI